MFNHSTLPHIREKLIIQYTFNTVPPNSNMPALKKDSSRYRNEQTNKIFLLWLKNPHDPHDDVGQLYYKYIIDVCALKSKKTLEKIKCFKRELNDMMVDYLQKQYEHFLKNKTIDIKTIDEMIYLQPIEEVRIRLWAMVDVWMLTYETPDIKLAEIADSEQNVHKLEVAKKTNNGIGILSNYDIPDDQNTLKEISKAWRFLPRCTDYVKVINDMKEWGSREQVMHKTDNIYRRVLRGLWAKIKTYENTVYTEILLRLYQECEEAVGLCADGHVARLINVLVGFDDDFHSSMSPMENFQHNISIIADTNSPLDFKRKNAIRLMDNINMPEDQRSVWLEALYNL